VPGNTVALLRDGREAFPAMLEAIEQARSTVLLEFYWFDSDRTGQRFAEALERATERGVEVVVIYDSFGSLDADRGQFARLRQAGAYVLEYNPIAPWRRHYGLPNLLRRDHRKILVVDDRVAFTGGINLGDYWAPEEDGGADYRDDMVRVEGPAARALGDLVRAMWRKHGKTPLRQPSAAPDAGSDAVQVLGQNFIAHQDAITRAYRRAIGLSRHRVWLRNSYFLPSGRMCRALESAASRGIDVRVLVPGISDVRLVTHATRSVYTRLLRAGVRIYEWQDQVLHAKSALVDDWSTVGTFNIDHFSVMINAEVNVGVMDGAFTAQMQESFERDFSLAHEIDAHEHRFRPLIARLLELLTYVVRALFLARPEVAERIASPRPKRPRQHA
jgi:cardiolipin synthase